MLPLHLWMPLGQPAERQATATQPESVPARRHPDHSAQRFADPAERRLVLDHPPAILQLLQLSHRRHGLIPQQCRTFDNGRPDGMAVGQDGDTSVALADARSCRSHRQDDSNTALLTPRRTRGDSWPHASQQQHTTGVGGVIGDSGGNCAGHFAGAHGACRRTRRCFYTCAEKRWHRSHG